MRKFTSPMTFQQILENAEHCIENNTTVDKVTLLQLIQEIHKLQFTIELLKNGNTSNRPRS